MGQYFYVVNLDKRQYLHPHVFDDGLKLMEFGNSGQATLLGLTVLLADSNGHGGGDFNQFGGVQPGLAELVGSWAGDRIVFTGDYSEASYYTRGGEPINDLDHSLYETAAERFQDISSMVIELLLQGGEGVRFDARTMADHDGGTDPQGVVIPDYSRAQRCVELVAKLPEWAQRGHPALEHRHHQSVEVS